MQYLDTYTQKGEVSRHINNESKVQYVNYYDRHVKEAFEKPTIGILLCKDKDDALVELTLPEDANVYATSYELCIPDKATLQSKVKQWILEYEESKED